MTKQSNFLKPLKPSKKFFDWCTSQIPTYEWKNKEKTILASQRKNCQIISKRLTINSQLNIPTKFYSFGIILVSTKRIEIQTHCYWQIIKNGVEILEYEQANLERFIKNNHFTYHYQNKNWYEGLVSNYGYMSGAYTNTVFYKNNWKERLASISELKYLDLSMRISHFDIERLYKYRNELEYLQKINAEKMVRHIVYQTHTTSGQREVDMRFINRKWLKRHKKQLSKADITFNQIMIEDYLSSKKISFIKGIENRISYKELKSLPQFINITRFQKWFINQTQSLKYYLDYVHMLEELNLNLSDEQVLFPKELEKAHDNAVATLNKLKRELKEKEYAQHQKELEKMEKEIDDLLFIVPKKLEEIVHEGSELHHCVGSSYYLNQHAKGETTIIFVRRKKNPKTPYFTLEYKRGKVVQTQGKYNREAIPSHVEQAIEKWKQTIKN